MMNTYLGHLELKARNDSRKESLRLALTSRFGELPEAIESALIRINEPNRLDALIRRAATAPTLDDIRSDLGV